ncbi:MAG TPA: hypothetical protein VG102_02610 [Candidatus Paceibacterota bacterium]|nr:hypothetical protein [Candidatus Paceibacterota bacterium]
MVTFRMYREMPGYPRAFLVISPTWSEMYEDQAATIAAINEHLAAGRISKEKAKSLEADVRGSSLPERPTWRALQPGEPIP